MYVLACVVCMFMQSLLPTLAAIKKNQMIRPYHLRLKRQCVRLVKCRCAHYFLAVQPHQRIHTKASELRSIVAGKLPASFLARKISKCLQSSEVTQRNNFKWFIRWKKSSHQQLISVHVLVNKKQAQEFTNISFKEDKSLRESEIRRLFG